VSNVHLFYDLLPVDLGLGLEGLALILILALLFLTTRLTG